MPDRGAQSTRARADAWAPSTLVAPRSGDHDAAGSPVAPTGSNTRHSPTVERHPNVSSVRSVLTLDSTAGPVHSKMPQIAQVDLPDCDGPTSITDPRTGR